MRDLVSAAEDVSIILLEATNPCETGKSARELVPVQDAEVSEPYRQLTIRVRLVLEDHAVTRTVHGLEALHLVVRLQEVEVLLVVLVVATRLPEVDAAQVGRDHFLVASLLILAAHEV